MWPFKKKPPEEHWRLVDTVQDQIYWRDDSDDGYNTAQKTDDVYYYLYESSLGNRRMEYKFTDRHLTPALRGEANVCKKIPFYLKTVYPWVKGSNATLITPTYWDLVEKENERCVREMYRRLLKGKV